MQKNPDDGLYCTAMFYLDNLSDLLCRQSNSKFTEAIRLADQEYYKCISDILIKKNDSPQNESSEYDIESANITRNDKHFNAKIKAEYEIRIINVYHNKESKLVSNMLKLNTI